MAKLSKNSICCALWHKSVTFAGMKYALITGSSSGIGLAYARLLAERGRNVVIVSNRAEDNEAVATAIRRDYGVEALALYADLVRGDAAEKIYEWCRERDIEIDILISNAGILHFGKLVHTAPETIDKIVAIHCTTPMKLCRLFGADMCGRGDGYILIMLSMTVWTPYPTMSLYGSTKALLRNFGQSLWYEMRECGVSVTTVFPGAVDTPLYDLSDKMRRRLRRFGVMMSAEEVARCGLRAMRHDRRKCIPGVLTKIEVALCRLLPARALLPFLRIPPIKRLLERL